MSPQPLCASFVPAASVEQALAEASRAGLPRLDAQRLLLHVLGPAASGRAWLHAHGADPVEPAAHRRFLALCERRAADVPLAYLIGTREFHGLTLAIDARVLDPRPDTETLVDWALDVCRSLLRPRVLDLGCGSGAVALAIKHDRRDAVVQAVDIAADALQVARANAAALSLDISFGEGDWLCGMRGAFELIVSNPPYIAVGDPHLAALQAEPIGALVSGIDGLDAIRRIVADARAHLAADGWLLLEHGHEQAAAVRALLAAAGFADVQSRRDLAGIERCSGGRVQAGR